MISTISKILLIPLKSIDPVLVTFLTIPANNLVVASPSILGPSIENTVLVTANNKEIITAKGCSLKISLITLEILAKNLLCFLLFFIFSSCS